MSGNRKAKLVRVEGFNLKLFTECRINENENVNLSEFVFEANDWNIAL